MRVFLCGLFALASVVAARAADAAPTDAERKAMDLVTAAGGKPCPRGGAP